VLFPRFSMTKLDNQSKNLYKEFTLISLLFTIIVFSTLSLVVKDFIALWITPEFAAGTKNIAIILSVSCMIRGAFPVYENLFKGIGKPVYNMYITIASSLIIVILDFLLIPRLGLDGAGLAYLISPIVGIFVIIYIWKRILKTSLNGPFKDYLMPLILSYALLAIFFFIKGKMNIEPSWSTIILQALGFVIIQVLMIFIYFKIFSHQSWETVLKVRYSVREIFKRDQQ
jgi:O-antigen/teichoic acid export membrane protein